MKRKILELMRGKRKMMLTTWDSYENQQKRLCSNEYYCFWRTDTKEVVYIDKKNILSGKISEKTFDSIDDEFGIVTK